MARYLLLIISLAAAFKAAGQDSVRFSGQLSSWLNISTGSDLPVNAGIRYIPQINFSHELKKGRLTDTELSANIYGNTGLQFFDSLNTGGNIKAYRAWIRYSSDQMEIRAGLQKINFGSAAMLRPLMWFDQMDPRDPLQLTDGVWGILGRYYFLNNANIWLWGLYGNKAPRGWDIIPSNRSIPELGGRIQLPVPGGEIALTYHHRNIDTRDLTPLIPGFRKIPENKIGFDAKWDLKTGLWIEGSYSNKEENLGFLTNQTILNAGADYTFGLGSGLYAAYEQLIVSFDLTPFSFDKETIFSVITCSYPVGMFDKLSTIFYYSWTDRNLYSFVNWHRQFDNIMLYLMAYWNPETFNLPAQSQGRNIFAGKGLQVMFVFNH